MTTLGCITFLTQAITLELHCFKSVHSEKQNLKTDFLLEILYLFVLQMPLFRVQVNKPVDYFMLQPHKKLQNDQLQVDMPSTAQPSLPLITILICTFHLILYW